MIHPPGSDIPKKDPPGPRTLYILFPYPKTYKNPNFTPPNPQIDSEPPQNLALSPAECRMRLIAARWRFWQVPAISAAAGFPARENLIVFWDFPNCKFYDVKNRKKVHNYNINIADPTTLVRHRTEPSSPISDFGADPA